MLNDNFTSIKDAEWKRDLAQRRLERLCPKMTYLDSLDEDERGEFFQLANIIQGASIYIENNSDN